MIRYFLRQLESSEGGLIRSWERGWGWQWFKVLVSQRDWEIIDHRVLLETQVSIYTRFLDIHIGGPSAVHIGDNLGMPVCGKRYWIWWIRNGRNFQYCKVQWLFPEDHRSLNTRGIERVRRDRDVNKVANAYQG